MLLAFFGVALPPPNSLEANQKNNMVEIKIRSPTLKGTSHNNPRIET